mmetsp:Transcript_28894/g.61521  ORF Transcript_28894/g.61521 Transcript_28894/m.61521 type:complete len:440 (-) Transcript_28894:218-1537(-)
MSAEAAASVSQTEGPLVWAGFWIVFAGLAAFDVFFLAPEGKKQQARTVKVNPDDEEDVIPGRSAIFHIAFWFCIGLLFNAVVFGAFGSEVGVVWFNGYILEYLLSLDNVFFFHVVFKTYATPPRQVYKALFLGILGAVVLRYIFYLIGGQFFRMAYVVQLLFGLLLVYSGYQTAVSDEDDEDPRENRCVQLITRFLPFVEVYDDEGCLLKRVPKTGNDGSLSVVDPEVLGVPTRTAVEAQSLAVGGDTRTVLRGTLLLLVVVVLQVVDIVFAVDSVTAKIAEYDSTFVNFSSSAFAMLCLRSLYFVLAKLLKYFRFLKFGVAAILVMIGIKLMINPWFKMEEVHSLAIICGVFAASIALSAAFPEAYEEQKDEADAKDDADAGQDQLQDNGLPGFQGLSNGVREVQGIANADIEIGAFDDSPIKILRGVPVAEVSQSEL